VPPISIYQYPRCQNDIADQYRPVCEKIPASCADSNYDASDYRQYVSHFIPQSVLTARQAL
jgi:hypothetical protein